MGNLQKRSKSDAGLAVPIFAIILAGVALAIGYCLMHGETLISIGWKLLDADTPRLARLIVAVAFCICAFLLGFRRSQELSTTAKGFLAMVFMALFPMLGMDIPAGRGADGTYHRTYLDTTPDDIPMGILFLLMVAAGYLLGFALRSWVVTNDDDLST